MRWVTARSVLLKANTQEGDCVNRLVRSHTASRGALASQNGLEFNMESGRKAAKTRSRGKFPEPQIPP